MSGNVIRFRAEPDLLATLASRAKGGSVHQAAHDDLVAYYKRIEVDAWPETRQRMTAAFDALHIVAFDAVQEVGCQATIRLLGDNLTPQEIPIYGDNGLEQSVKIMAERGLLPEGEWATFHGLHAMHQQIILAPDEPLSLGESYHFLLEAETLKQKFAQFLPPHWR